MPQSPHADEITAMLAIYPDRCIHVSHSRIDFSLATASGAVLLSCMLHDGYPQKSIPDYTLSLPHNKSLSSEKTIAMDRHVQDTVHLHFLRLFNIGEEVLYSWNLYLEEYLIEIYGVESIIQHLEIPAEHPVESQQLEDVLIIPEGCPIIHHSAPLVEKKSIFIAHVAKVSSLSDISLVNQSLYSNKSTLKATHNISAYRIVEDNGVIRQDCDDDGENAAGGRLLHLLELLDVKNVVVVVSRWYGGIQLGPKRFKIINNVARRALEENGFINPR